MSKQSPISLILFGNCIQLARLVYFKCRACGNEVLQYEADLKTFIYYGGDVLQTPEGVLLFYENC